MGAGASADGVALDLKSLAAADYKNALLALIDAEVPSFKTDASMAGPMRATATAHYGPRRC